MAASGEPDSPKYRDMRTERFAAGDRIREFESFKDQAESAWIFWRLRSAETT